MGDKKRSSSNGMIRVGVVGVGRGQSFMEGAIEELGMELVAICDTWKEKLEEVGERYGVATYTDYDEFLEHDMDAV
ncbi:MAG: Gfo/Idh/MocA family oxidoreductase, partial [Clostridiales bacterium]|nr:Gfo/Idh/MocA family oxidoreductase [Clostridiales bacterium]